VRILFSLLALALTGCIAVSARAHVAGVTSGVGSGVQVGVTLGVGLTVNERTAVVESIGAASGTAPELGLIGAVDYVRLPDHDDGSKLAWRAGVGGQWAFVGAPILAGARFAGMYLISDKYSFDRGGEKCCGSSWDRSVVAIGIEGELGVAGREVDAPMSETTEIERSVGASAGLTIEWLQMMTWSP
jgi:hypothetical protein